MNDDTPISSEVYEGPSKATVVLGQGKLYGWIGTLVGIPAGILASELFSKQLQWLTPKATGILKRFNIPVTDKAVIRAAGGFAGYVVGHYGAAMYGYAKGGPLADRAKAQFEQVKSERDAARAKLAEAEGAAPEAMQSTQPAEKKHTADVLSREAEGGHAAATLAASAKASALPPR